MIGVLVAPNYEYFQMKYVRGLAMLSIDKVVLASSRLSVIIRDLKKQEQEIMKWKKKLKIVPFITP